MVTRSQSRGPDPVLGTVVPKRAGSQKFGMADPEKETRVTAESSHGPIKTQKSRDSGKSRETLTLIKKTLTDFGFGDPNQQFGTKSTGYRSPTQSEDKDLMSFRDASNESPASYNLNESYHEDITYGEEQENILDELLQEDEQLFVDEDGNKLHSNLRERMDPDADDEIAETQATALNLEHVARTKALKAKQGAIDREMEILLSTQQAQAKAKRMDDFHRKQAEIQKDLVEQQKIIRKKRAMLEKLRREVTAKDNDESSKDEWESRKPNQRNDKGKEPEHRREPPPLPKKENNGADDGDDGGNDPDDDGWSDISDDSIRSHQSQQPHRSQRRHRTYTEDYHQPQLNNLKYPTPPKFDGSPRKPVATWLFNVDTFFDAVGAADTQRTPYAALLLDGNAQTWWRSLKEKGTQPRRWDQFKILIEEQFYTINDDRKARDALRNLKQTTSVTNYIADFTNLTLRIKDMSDADIYYEFMTGLKREVREEMEKRDLPQHLRTLQSHASTYDDLLFNQRSSHRPEHGRFPMKRDYDRRNWEKRPERRNVHAVEATPTFRREVTCYNCNEKGHISKDCKKPRKTSGFRPGYKTRFNTKWRKPGASYSTTKPESTRAINVITRLQKTDPEVKTPVYATPGSAGLDIRPNLTGSILPFETIKIPTGLAIEVPKGHCMIVKTRSSGLLNGIHVDGLIDEDYRKELHLIVYNRNQHPVEFTEKKQPIAQVVVLPYIQLEFNEVTQLEQTTRKGGFGSTDVKAISSRPGKLTYPINISGKNEETLIDSGADGIYIPERIAR